MSKASVDVTRDQLVIDGTVFPPSGESERWRIAFPPSAEATDGNSGDTVIAHSPAKSAILTLSCYQTDQAHLLASAKFAKQEALKASGSGLAGGSAPLATFTELSDPRVVRWGSTVITQPSDVVSSQKNEIVTWVFTLVDAVRVGV